MTDTSEVYWYSKIFRWLFAMIDKIVYGLVSFITDTFNLLAGSEIRTGETVGNIFARIQLILGIIILFKLVISFFSGIVDPDGFNDSKKGFGNVIKRIVVVLVMMLLIVPLHIPENDVVDLEKAEGNSQKTWNARMNDSGILFGTLAEIQSRIMNGNLIPRLILGTDHADEGEEDIPLLLLKNFIFINLNPGAKDSTEPDNWLCPIDRFENSSDEDDKAVTAMQILNNEKVIFEYQTEMHCENESAYSKEDIEKMGSQEGWELIDDKDSPKLYAQYVAGAFDKSNQDKCAVKIEKLDEDDPKVDKKLLLERKRETLLESINYKCDLNHIGVIDRSGGERYIFVYKFFLSTVAGILCFVLLLSLTVDVAIRVFKLLLLRLISPVAILSYIDPKSEKTFNNWVKAVATTFLDLFIRIAIISFIMLFISFIKDFDFTSTYNGEVSFVVQSFARLILFFGLFFFAKEAPKFITETLGIDSKNGGGLFGGFGKLMGGILGGVSIGAGAIGAFNASRKASKYVDDANGVAPAHWWSKLGNRGKHVVAGLLGAAGGTATGIGAFARSKDHAVSNTRKAMQQRNANILSNARNGGTFFGAVGSTIGQDLLGEDAYSRMEAGWKAQEQQIKNEELALKAQQDSLKSRKEMNRYKKDIMDEVTAKTVDSLDTKGSYGKLKDVNYYRFHSAVEAALANGVGVSTLADGTKVFNWNNQQIKLDELRLYDNEIRKANEADYYYRAITNNGVDNARIREAYRDGRITQTVYGGANGLKAAFGAEERDIGRLSNILNDQYQRLSDRRQQINDERQSTAAQRAESNSKRFKNNQ